MPMYSVAEARNRSAEIVHDLKHVSWVEVTRRGRPVALFISEELARLAGIGRAPQFADGQIAAIATTNGFCLVMFNRDD